MVAKVENWGGGDHNVCRIVAEDAVSRGAEDYGFVDLKGRAVGYLWSIVSVAVELIEEGSDESGYRHEIGYPLNYFRVWGSPSRNGKSYGPGFNVVNAKSMAEAEKLVAKRIAAAKKRDAKKFAKSS